LLNLADLILLTETLPTASDFVAYVAKRREMLSDQVLVYVEADALGRWCEDRLSTIGVLRDQRGKAISTMVTTTSDWMNDFYTVRSPDEVEAPKEEVEEYRRRHPKSAIRPSTGLPPAVIEALERMVEENDPLWFESIGATLAVRPKSWRPVARLIATAAAARRKPPARQKARLLRRAVEGYGVDGKVVLTLRPASEGHVQLSVAPLPQLP
jgi:hypothetical protein